MYTINKKKDLFNSDALAIYKYTIIYHISKIFDQDRLFIG